MDEFVEDVSDLSDFGVLNMYQNEVQWSGKVIDFDLEFLNKSLSTFTSLKILNDSIDTAKLAERIEEKTNPNLYREDRKQFQLDSLCRKYEIPSFARHHALSDAVTTGILFLKLQKKWIRMGNEQLKTLYF
jgi:DNA polymerase III alpha subunit (gram-positive type)